MDYPFEHPDFEGRTLAVRMSGFFNTAVLVVDGAEVVGKKGKFSLYDNQGRACELKLKASILDPIPKVMLGDATVSLARPLAWYEYAWMGLPIVLVFSGGALGAMFGILASYSSSRIFRSDRGVGAKYMLSGMVSLGAVAGFLASVTALQFLIAANTDPASKQALVGIARVTNKDLPTMIDDETELVKLEGLEGVLVYYYRLPKIGPGQISSERFLQRLSPTIMANICADPASRERFLENGVVIRYVYNDSENGMIGEFDVSLSDCL